MLELYRRHTKKCPHSKKGQRWTKCSWPIWCYGTDPSGKTVRETLKTRDWQRAIRKIEKRESPDAKPENTLSEAIADFEAVSADLSYGTKQHYKRMLRLFPGFSLLSSTAPELVERFRAAREVGLLTWTKELHTLRHFFRFCEDREWIERKPPKRIAMPRNIKPTDKEPYGPADMIKIIAACDVIGRRPYERLRARAMVLVPRYTALGSQTWLRWRKIGSKMDGSTYAPRRPAIPITAPRHFR